MIKKFIQRKNRFIRNEKIAFLLLPMVLIPLLLELILHTIKPQWFIFHEDQILIANVIYIVVARFIMLDVAIYIFSRTRSNIHFALFQIVLLYLEVTIITIIYYALIFDIFDVFSLFHLSAKFTPENFAIIHKHSFITSMYISTVTFTTLGSGDWIPQTLPAMIAVISEVILGVVQGGVFVAIVIYSHQNSIVKKN